MSVNYYNMMGKMRVTQTTLQDGKFVRKNYTIGIWTSNCIACFNYTYKGTDGNWYDQLFDFIPDANNAKRRLRHKTLFNYKPKNIELNMAFTQAKKLLTLFLSAGYSVKCYKDESKLPK